jgi:hypothetical protein
MRSAAIADGNARTYILVASLIVDSRFPQKQAIATSVLRIGLKNDSVRISHQALMEFMAVIGKVRLGRGALLLLGLPHIAFPGSMLISGPMPNATAARN